MIAVKDAQRKKAGLPPPARGTGAPVAHWRGGSSGPHSQQGAAPPAGDAALGRLYAARARLLGLGGLGRGAGGRPLPALRADSSGGSQRRVQAAAALPQSVLRARGGRVMRPARGRAAASQRGGCKQLRLL